MEIPKDDPGFAQAFANRFTEPEFGLAAIDATAANPDSLAAVTFEIAELNRKFFEAIAEIIETEDFL